MKINFLSVFKQAKKIECKSGQISAKIAKDAKEAELQTEKIPPCCRLTVAELPDGTKIFCMGNKVLDIKIPPKK